jgi:probable rRNA maturation factor
MRRSPVVDIRRTVSGVPSIPFEKIATHILGPQYQLSIVVCGDTLSRTINRKYRKKDYSPNVLSFSLDKNEGEIFLNLRKAEREAHNFGTSARDHLALLFVHGCFHLKGLAHGAGMERREAQVLRRFGFALSTA